MKTCQVRSCEEQVALFGGSAAGRHLGNFHCLANPPTALAALFKITALHSLSSSVHRSKSVCTAFSLFSVISLVWNQCRPRSRLFCTGQNQSAALCTLWFSSVPRFLLGDFYITCSPAINVLWMFWLKASPFVQNHSLLSQMHIEIF